MRRILFICMGNCVRSQLAEAILRKRGGRRFKPFSAGAFPAGFVHGMTLQVLEERHISTRKLRSKHWEEMADKEFDAIVTLCDEAREHVVPEWPAPRRGERGPMFAHWSVPDPIHANVIGLDERLEEFRRAREDIAWCIEQMMRAPERMIDDDEAFAGLLQQIGASMAAE